MVFNKLLQISTHVTNSRIVPFPNSLDKIHDRLELGRYSGTNSYVNQVQGRYVKPYGNYRNLLPDAAEQKQGIGAAFREHPDRYGSFEEERFQEHRQYGGGADHYERFQDDAGLGVGPEDRLLETDVEDPRGSPEAVDVAEEVVDGVLEPDAGTQFYTHLMKTTQVQNPCSEKVAEEVFFTGSCICRVLLYRHHKGILFLNIDGGKRVLPESVVDLT